MSAWDLLEAFNLFILGYFFVLNASYLVMNLLAFRELRRYADRLKSVRLESFMRSVAPPPVTLIAPAYNEERTCLESVRALLALEYPDFEVLVVNDGSTDGTLNVLREAFELSPASRFPTARIPTETVRQVWRSRTHPNLWVVDKENGGKADALNAGINYCRTPLFCAMDADSVLEREALMRLARPFMEDVSLVAAGGIVRIANGCTVRDGTLQQIRLPGNLLARFQVLEYLRAFLGGRMGWDAVGATLIISGAFGVFRRSAVVEAGGYRSDTVGEDMELVVRLHRHFREKDAPYTIRYIPDPVAWTECPESLRVLGQQRDRWQRGLIESLVRHVRMLFNPRYGRIGMLAFPYFLFFEMLGPIIEFGGYVAFLVAVFTGNASNLYIFTFLALAVAFGVTISVTSVALEELTFRRYPRIRDLFHLFWLAIAENFGYRQLITFWRMRGVVSKLRRVDTWGTMERRGFTAPDDDQTSADEPRRKDGPHQHRRKDESHEPRRKDESHEHRSEDPAGEPRQIDGTDEP